MCDQLTPARQEKELEAASGSEPSADHPIVLVPEKGGLVFLATPSTRSGLKTDNLDQSVPSGRFWI